MSHRQSVSSIYPMPRCRKRSACRTATTPEVFGVCCARAWSGFKRGARRMATAALAKPAHRPAKAGPVRSRGQAAALRALAVAHSFGPVQAKLIVGPAHDRFETEADAAAERVMRMPEGEIRAEGSASAG